MSNINNQILGEIQITTNTTKTTTDREQFSPELLKTHQKTEPQRFIPIRRRSNMLEKLSRIATVIIGLPLVLSGSFLLKPNAALAGGGFAQSCNSLILYKNSPGMLYGNCRRADGTWNNQARIQLNDYITNNNGTLGWQPNGNFLGSCDWDTDAQAGSGSFPTGLNQQFPNFIGFHTSCKDNGGAKNITPDINLNDRIINDNGDLKYGG
ncbi:CVNH domain-containing protein [Nostoc sp.]|uniref:CVNH domain-containing protein n=1 Tax=Nostoc sp. TaxID=1180 RepID=UPI002FF963CE